MNYVAIVGSQVMAVLNPLLSLVGNKLKPHRVTLLTTDFCKSYGESIKGYLVENGLFTESEVEIVPISDGTEGGSAERSAHDIVRELQTRDELYFDIAGGMNFQIAACIQAVDAERCTFVYPEDSSIQLYKVSPTIIEKGRLSLPNSIDVFKLLGVQGVHFQLEEDRTLNPFLQDTFKRAGVNLPKHVLTNVRLSYTDADGVVKWGPVFDVVINSGNKLKLIHVICRSDVGVNETIFARQIIAIGAGRIRLGSLYDREILVVTNVEKVAERIKSEEGNKIKAIMVSKQNNYYRKNLLRFFKAEQENNQNLPSPKSIETGRSVGSGKVLYTSVGPNLLPTLAAVLTHAPDEVRLLYTPSEHQVVELIQSITAGKTFLNVSRITFVPVTFTGEDILELLPPDSSMRVEVNITPGTKAQSAFLALWAKENGFETFSINRSTAEIMSLAGNGSKPVILPAASEYLELSGVDLKSEGCKPDAAAAEILTFLRGMLASGKSMQGFSYHRVNLRDGRSLIPDREKMTASIVSAQGKDLVTFKHLQKTKEGKIVREGFWFEPVVGTAVMEGGADLVEVNIKTAWSERVSRWIKNKDDHMSEVDVTAIYKGDYHVFSCKLSSSGDKLMRDVADAEAQTFIFGRMAIPYLVVLGYEDEPKLHDNVWVFGYRTLLDPVKLRELLDKGRETRRTTGRSMSVAGLCEASLVPSQKANRNFIAFDSTTA